jgi:methanethiol S-methyltransferase
MLRKTLTFTYGAVAYLAFLGAFLYTIGFLAGAVVPKDVDDGTVRPVWQAVLVDLALLGLFAVQHSVMARPWFKQRWTRIVPPAIERSTYVLAATVALVLLLWLWQPWPTTVWSVDAGWARAALWSLYLLGWGFLVLSFREPPLYRVIRHPIMVGFLIAFWAVPDMSAGRLLFAAASTAYIMVGVRLEEHDLKQQLGAPYADYLDRVPRFVPRPKVSHGEH